MITSGKSFCLHVDVLSAKCEYFRACLTGHFLEAITKQLALDVSDTTFGFFLKWVYGDSIKPMENPSFCHQHNETSLTLASLFDLWFFADYVQAIDLKNHVITNAVQKLQNVGTQITDEGVKQIADAIRVLWKGKARTDQGELAKPLRDLLLDVVANPRCMVKAKAEKLLKTMPPSFLREFAVVTVARNFTVHCKTVSLADALEENHSEGDMYDEDFGFEAMASKIEMAEMSSLALHEMWLLVPKKYFVNNPEKEKEENK